MTAVSRLRAAFWERHSNPKSGWSRVLILPALLYAVYRRDWKLAGAAVGFTVVNPVLFSPPADDDAWMTRVVLAERWWTEERGEPVLATAYPSVLNLLNLPVTAYAFVAAYRGNPVRAVLGGLGSVLLKFWYVGALVQRYDEARSE